MTRDIERSCTRAAMYYSCEQAARHRLHRRHQHLARRLSEHRAGIGSAFVRKYRLRLLVLVEPFDRIDEAIAREKQIKEWRQAWKWEWIEKVNPAWRDLSAYVHDFS